jgi:hypothetical protein
MSCIPREITRQSFGRLTAVRRVGPCTRAALWVVKKGRSLGGLDFDKGGYRFLADRVGPPFQSSTQLARSSAAPHRLHDLASSHPASTSRNPMFSRETWQRDLARAENREIAGVLERGLVS